MAAGRWALLLPAAAAGLADALPRGGPIGILGQSGGDVQTCSEVEPYSKNLFADCILPRTLPEEGRRALADLMWADGAADTLADYHSVPNADCNTRFQDVSRAVTAATVDRVRALTGYDDIHPFSGWKFLYGAGVVNGTPTVLDALAEMQAAGVDTAYVFDQDGLSYDADWQGGTYRQIREYLANHTEWNATFVGINGITTQPGYMDLMTAKVKEQVDWAFPGAAPADVCVLLISQGSPVDKETGGTSGIPGYRKVYAELQPLLPYNLTLAFMNHKPSSGPTATVPWSAPDEDQKIPEIAANYSCAHVLATPIIQWPQTDYVAYTYQGNGTPNVTGFAVTFAAAGKRYRHAPAWDLKTDLWEGRPVPAGTPIPPEVIDPALPSFNAKIIADAMAGKTDGYNLTVIRQNHTAA